MGTNIKEAIPTIPIDPKVLPAISRTVDFVMTSIQTLYPAVETRNVNGEVTENSMIRSVDQIHAVEGEDLPKIEQTEKKADDVFLYTLLKGAGIPEEHLMPLMYSTRKQYFYYNPYHPQLPERTQLYVHRGYVDAFEGDDKADQLSAAFNLAGVLIEANLNLVPTPREIPVELRERFKGYIVGQKEGLISSLESQYQQNVDSQTTEVVDEVGNSKPIRNIEIARALIEEFILKEGDEYNPRFVAFGGKVLFIMPHQDLVTAELVIGTNLQTNICQYLSKGVLDIFFDLLTEDFGIKGLNRKPIYTAYISPDFMNVNERIRPFLDSFAIGQPKRLMDEFRNSEIPFIYERKVNAKKGKFNPTKYPD